ncbi:hypothetical protein PMI42_06238 [Bradyrhizobium sp. YR681]|uniref:hypothetical protein n=1 Tax=Bradyrhizobium sp. YR681 TaxID=1144344 RepID=UPI00026FB9F4|nr:hypothetical protein [Bradyrhizobium sp. YR681]EJN10462.1 hypothetical protein PMI42_06238 [Bradyrhizobium sp. YR681]
MGGLTFEWTFRAGDLLTLVGGLSVAAAFLYRRGGDDVTTRLTLRAMRDELAEMKDEFKSFGETLKKVAIQEMQIGLLMKWYDELRNGHGYVERHDKK